MNITELAVEKSPRTIDTVTAVASNGDGRVCQRKRRHLAMYLIE